MKLASLVDRSGIAHGSLRVASTWTVLQVLSRGLLAANGRTWERLAEQGRRSAWEYTLDAMVEHFADGIAACVAAPRLR